MHSLPANNRTRAAPALRLRRLGAVLAWSTLSVAMLATGLAVEPSAWNPAWGYQPEEWHHPRAWFGDNRRVDYESDYYDDYFDDTTTPRDNQGDQTDRSQYRYYTADWYEGEGGATRRSAGLDYYTADWYDAEPGFDLWY